MREFSVKPHDTSGDEESCPFLKSERENKMNEKETTKKEHHNNKESQGEKKKVRSRKERLWTKKFLGPHNLETSYRCHFGECRFFNMV